MHLLRIYSIRPHQQSTLYIQLYFPNIPLRLTLLTILLQIHIILLIIFLEDVALRQDLGLFLEFTLPGLTQHSSDQFYVKFAQFCS